MKWFKYYLKAVYFTALVFFIAFLFIIPLVVPLHLTILAGLFCFAFSLGLVRQH